MTDGKAMMIRQQAIPIEANTMINLKPGSYHLMLMNPLRSLKAGEKVELQLHFDNGATVEVQAMVRRQ